MTGQLTVSVGQHSDRGRKATNQDFHGVLIPPEPQLTTKGIAAALADGISSSDVSQIASQAAVGAFLDDYFATPETWSVKKSGQRVLAATNSWLHAQTRQSQYRYDADRGYVCTFSALVVRSTTVHLFHAGDARIYRMRDGDLEQLTNDHRLWVSQDKSYLSRAMGITATLEIDYHAFPAQAGDLYLITTDGIHEYVAAKRLRELLAVDEDLDALARSLTSLAYAAGSDDNLTAMIVRIDSLPNRQAHEARQQTVGLPIPPVLEARAELDGYRIIRTLHASARSHVYLASDSESTELVVLKVPSIDLAHSGEHLERFGLEEWIARRIDSPYVLKAAEQGRTRRYLYGVFEYVEGQTLAQWMIDHPKPPMEKVRDIIEQIVRGLRAFHRLEMLHQDLRPANILIDASGTVKLIDFGTAHVPGVTQNSAVSALPPGAAQYAAPEYFLGEPASERSDQFSLAVITYQMLTGRLPYGVQVTQCRTAAARRRLRYLPLGAGNGDIPEWIDDVLRKALHPLASQRFEALSEFTFELRNPRPAGLQRVSRPLIERDPVRFWQGVSLLLTVALLASLLLR
ncbi:bifunctional protein-serine/threonine kinase/phosphatase [Pseudomonas matsuisoli]|uniref:Protein kinase n=1 Tax=Pseudomonas matsuisoli TaxID=1515666 RepID=A0A917PHP0_9PSED|nr:bifunctional protein-serine/threonine kinase/phosphatase [Pseudomonas matsuisoli]GGJ79364.1 protein kinase [Pseudomonas matsuisoli]